MLYPIIVKLGKYLPTYTCIKTKNVFKHFFYEY